MMDLGGLNEAQKAAVKHGRGPMLVVAGAGTGKTEVIAQRIAYLINTEQSKPSEILALTFTEKAAGEMIDRLDSLIGWSAHQVNVMTFHAFGAQLLVRYGHHIGLPNRAELITKNIKMLLLRQHISELNLSYYGSQSDLLDFIGGCVDYIEGLQNYDIGLEQYAKHIDRKKHDPETHKMDLEEASDRFKIYKLYEQLKRRYGLIDHHDQIKLPLELMAKRPNIAGKLSQQYRFVLVDEYQDTNASQDMLLRSFIKENGNIFAVGDDDQAIYGFRGARVGNILSFADHFSVKQPIVLTRNYRSTQAILDSAYRMIQHNNPNRLEFRMGLDKKLKAAVPGLKPSTQIYNSFSDEVNSVADMIGERLKSGTAADQVGVLATTHSVLQTLSRALRRRNIPHRLVSTVKIFEQRELLHLWYLLRWVGMSADDEAIAQLLMGPFFDWEPSGVRVLTDLARQELIGHEEALERIAKGGHQLAVEAVEAISGWRRWSQDLSVSELAYRLITDTGLSEKWIAKAGDTPRMVRVFEDLQQLLRQMQDYEGIANDRTLTGYLSLYPQPPDLEAADIYGDETGVALLTVHAAKGLEFETVFIINNTRAAWTERAVPQTADVPAELKHADVDLPPEHERRRLMYVAMTRAKRELILTASEFSSSGRARQLNPYLLEALEPVQIVDKRPIQLTNKLELAIESLGRFAPNQREWQQAKLPFEASDGWLDLNITDIDKYLHCPYEFYLEKVLKISSPLGPQIKFGSLLHQLFNEYYQGKLMGEPLGLDELSARLEDRWSDRGYRTESEAKESKQRALETLRHFYTREEQRGHKIKSSEETINLKIPEAKLRLKGRIDLMVDTPTGIQVRDFKTGRLRDKEKLDKKAKDNFQLRTYALATKEMTGQIPDTVVLDYVVTQVEGEAKLTPAILQNHRDKLIKISDDIRARRFEPKKDLYHKCIAHKYWGSDESEE